jgi:type VI protein secretion system component VasK
MATERAIFALICCIGVIAVAVGALLEVGRIRRGDSIIPPRQFRLRLFSALIWAITLASLAYAVLFLWPQRGEREQATRFLSVMSGVVLLIAIGLILLAYDFWLVGQARRLQQAKFERNIERDLDAMGRAEIERVQQERTSTTEPSPNSSADGAGS